MTDPPSRYLISDLCQLMDTYLEPAQVQEVYRAYLTGAEAHEGQLRQSGDPYIYHPIEVARILAELRLDAPTLAAAILHDVIEDTSITKAQVQEKFGEHIAELVDGVSKLDQVGSMSKAETKAASFQKMVLAMARDIRVILIKLADRLHNMRTLGAKKPESRRRIARETLEIYAPIAARLGIRKVSRELEELSFAALYPWRCRVLRFHLQKLLSQGKRQEISTDVEMAIKRRLRQEAVEAEVTGLPLRVYSVYRRMREHHLAFEDAAGECRFRIVAPDQDTCYRVMGFMHSLYKPRPGGFKDYIAIPKSNGYQSLHTALIGPQGRLFQAQIRTQKMQVFAESGIVTHGLYKTGEDTIKMRQRASEWLRGLLELQKNAGNSIEFLDSFKLELFPEEIYVFTPHGKIIELPRGASAIDFAYAIHTGIGDSMIQARVNGELVPPGTVLRNGQTIEIITAAYARPRLEWLDCVVSARARAHIRHFLRNLQQGEAMQLGQQMLDRELSRFGLAIARLDEPQRQAIASAFQGKSLDSLLEEIGLGNRPAFLVACQLAPAGELGQLSHAETAGQPLVIKGTEGMMVSLGQCCYPIPGDPIRGYVSNGKGIIVHASQCKQAADQSHQPWLELTWANDPSAEFPVLIELNVADQRGVLASIAAAFANLGANIRDVATRQHDKFSTTLQFCIAVRGRNHLATIIRHLRRIRFVNRIHRIRAG